MDRVDTCLKLNETKGGCNYAEGLVNICYRRAEGQISEGDCSVRVGVSEIGRVAGLVEDSGVAVTRVPN